MTSMQRVVLNAFGNWDVYAGDRGLHIATTMTQEQGYDALREWADYNAAVLGYD